MGRHAFRTLLLALTTVLALYPSTAFGATPIDQLHDHFTDSFSSEICGITVDVELVVTDNFFLLADDSFKDTSSVRSTYTNPEKVR